MIQEYVYIFKDINVVIELLKLFNHNNSAEDSCIAYTDGIVDYSILHDIDYTSSGIIVINLHNDTTKLNDYLFIYYLEKDCIIHKDKLLEYLQENHKMFTNNADIQKSKLYMLVLISDGSITLPVEDYNEALYDWFSSNTEYADYFTNVVLRKDENKLINDWFRLFNMMYNNYEFLPDAIYTEELKRILLNSLSNYYTYCSKEMIGYLH